MKRAIPVLVVLLAILVPNVGSRAQEPPPPATCDGCYVPPVDVDWQYQLRSAPDPAPAYDLWLIDMFDTNKSLVGKLHNTGGSVGCYISAGSWENWRPDASDFPRSVRGKAIAGWAGERWLDIRALDVLQPIMTARLDDCAAKGFDTVDFDNVNGYQASTGFHITASDQLTYNRWLANAAHEHGLSVGLKNDGEQAPELVSYFDFAIVEQCFEYHECGQYRPFTDAGKAVLEVEYKLKRSQFCSKARQLSFRSIRKHYSLGRWRRAC